MAGADAPGLRTVTWIGWFALGFGTGGFIVGWIAGILTWWMSDYCERRRRAGR